MVEKNLHRSEVDSCERRALRQAPAVAPLVGFGHVERCVDARPVLLGQFVRVALELEVPCQTSARRRASPQYFAAGPRHGPRLCVARRGSSAAGSYIHLTLRRSRRCRSSAMRPRAPFSFGVRLLDARRFISVDRRQRCTAFETSERPWPRPPSGPGTTRPRNSRARRGPSAACLR